MFFFNTGSAKVAAKRVSGESVSTSEFSFLQFSRQKEEKQVESRYRLHLVNASLSFCSFLGTFFEDIVVNFDMNFWTFVQDLASCVAR